jgi:DNA-binding XRE family transcriptional regulator
LGEAAAAAGGDALGLAGDALVTRNLLSVEVLSSAAEDARVDRRDRFAANLRAAREAKGISQEALAGQCEIHRTEVSLLERGGREPRLGTLIKLATALDTTPEALCAGISWVPKTRRFKIERAR